MKRKVIISALAVVLVLMMALAVFVACNNALDKEFYKITYYANGNFVSLTNVIAGQSLKATDIPIAPASDVAGEVFDCWMSGDDVIEVGYVPTGDVTAEAVYRAPMAGEYIVSFDLGAYDGAEAAPADMVASGNGMIVLPQANVTWQNYTLLGWMLDGQLYEVGYTYQVTSNVTFVAKWQYFGTSAMRFETNGGSEIEDIVGKKAGTFINAPADPEKAGFTFAGWYLDPEFGGEAVELPDKMPDGEFTYYAKWVTRYTVRRMLQDVTLDGYTANDEIVDIDEGEPLGPVRIYKALEGFDYVSGDTTINPQNGETYELVYDRMQFTVTYRLNLAGYSVSNEQTDDVVYGQHYEVKGEVYKGTGVMLLGWALATDGEVVEAVDITGDTDLFGQWKHGIPNKTIGDDYLYWFEDEPDVVLLQREGFDEYIEGAFDVESGRFEIKISPDYGSRQATLTGRLDIEGNYFVYDREGAATYYLYDEANQQVVKTSYVTLNPDGTAHVVVTDGVFSTVVPSYSLDGAYINMRRITVPGGAYDCSYTYDSANSEYLLNLMNTEFGISAGWARETQDDSPDPVYYDVFFARGEEKGVYCEALDTDNGALLGAIARLTGYGVGEILIGDDEDYSCEYTIQEGPLGKEVVFDLTEQTGETYTFLIGDQIAASTPYTMMGEQIFIFTAYDPTAAGTYVMTDGDWYEPQTLYSVTLTGYDYAIYTDYTGDEPQTQNLLYSIYGYYSMYRQVEDYGGDVTTYAYNVALLDLYTYTTNTNGEIVSTERFKTLYALSIYDDYSMAWDNQFAFVDEDTVGMRYADMTFDGREFGYFLMYTDGADGNGMIWFDYDGMINEGTFTEHQGDDGYYYTFNDPYGGYYNFDFTVWKMPDEKQYAFNIDTTPLAGSWVSEDYGMLVVDPTGAATYYDIYLGEYEGGYIDNMDSTYTFIARDANVMFDFTVDNTDASFTILDLPQAPDVDTYYMYNGRGYYSNVYFTVDEDGNVEFTYLDNVIVKGTISLHDAAFETWCIDVTEVIDEAAAQRLGLTDGFFAHLLSAPAEEGYVELFVIDDDLTGMYQLSDSVILSLDGFGYGYLTLISDDQFVTMMGTYDVMTDSSYYDDGHPIVALTIGSIEYYFDFWNDGTITLRGEEGYKMYYLTDGSSLYNFFLLLDGNGNADIVFNYKDDTGSTYYYLAETGEYAMLNGSYGVAQFTFDEFYVDGEYFKDQDEVDFLNEIVDILPQYGITNEFVFCLVTLGSYECFIIYDESFDDVMVLGDGSVLITDGFFNATYIDMYGEVYNGTYAVEYYGEDEDDSYTLIRFYGNYGDDFTFVDMYNVGNFRKVGNEYGSYAYAFATSATQGIAGELFLNGNGSVSYAMYYIVYQNGGWVMDSSSGAAIYTGTYTYDSNLSRVEATFTTLNYEELEEPETDVFELDMSDSSFIFIDRTMVGEFVNTDNDADKMYGNGFGVFLHVDEDGQREIWYYYGYSSAEDLHYMFPIVDGKAGDMFELRIDFEQHTFTLSNPEFELSVTSMWDVATGKMVEKTVEVDGFNNVTIDGVPSGTVVSSGEANGGGYVSYTIYTTSTGAKFATFLCTLDTLRYATAWAPYLAQYDVTLNEEDGVGTIVLDGMANAMLPTDDGIVRTVFSVQDDVLVTDNFYHSSDKDITNYYVNWEAHTYKTSGELESSDFVIEDGVLTAYNGSATDIVIPDEVRKIADKVFDVQSGGVAITSVDLKNVEEVGAYAFRGEKLSAPTLLTVTGTENLRIIGQEAFEYSKLTSISLPAVETIAEKAFYGSQYFESVTIGANCTTIGSSAFGGVGMKGKGSVEYHFQGESAPTLGSATALGTATKVVAIYFTSQTALDQAKAAWTTYTAVCQLEQG